MLDRDNASKNGKIVRSDAWFPILEQINGILIDLLIPKMCMGSIQFQARLQHEMHKNFIFSNPSLTSGGIGHVGDLFQA
jgi:hypothetical protein